MEMENLDTEDGVSKRPGARRLGGLKTMPFIIGNEAFEKIASYGLLPNMIFYLLTYNFTVAGATSILFVWNSISSFTPILGAFLSDSYFGRFLVISVGTVITLMGLIVLWLTAVFEGARPPECHPLLHNCINPTAGQMALLFIAYGLMSIGAGGVRPCSIAFGADQFEDPKNPKNERIVQSFFSWYYATLGLSLILAVTVIVYIQTEHGWIIGFGVPVCLMIVSATMFFLGSRFYIKVKANQSLLTGLFQVLVASWRNRHQAVVAGEIQYLHDKESKYIAPTKGLRWFNKACIIKNSAEDLNRDGSASNPWSLCNVMQVEVLKTVIRLFPLWSTGITIAVTISQHSFPPLQASTLDRRLIGNFEIPAGSFGLFGILTVTMWVGIYDRIIAPFASKYTKNPRGIGVKTRIGAGLFVSCLATATSALVEQTRRARALHEGLAYTPKAQVNMSAAWIIPQHCLTGLAEALNAIGLIELFYSQLPKSMGSVAVAFFSMTLAVGNLVAALVVNIVDSVSKRGGRVSWVSSNLNLGHYDYYYWVLTAMSVANFFYFILCSWAYEGGNRNKIWDEDVVELQEAKTGASGEVVMVHNVCPNDSLPSEYFST